jgi:predicted RNase H-like HicB family nuclease
VDLGDTIEECEREMRDPIVLHIDGLRRAGEPTPEPAAAAASVVDVA